jgi:hypothetical protein
VTDREHAAVGAEGKLPDTGGYARSVPVDTEPGSYEMIFGKRAFFGYAMAPDGEVWWFANVPPVTRPGAVKSRPLPAMKGADDSWSSTPRTPAPPSSSSTPPRS